ncbi:MAG: NAD(P)/FAD-dependent oxidoreductase [Eubacteriales bacterium]|jgi:protoporphyrinogen oxidase
MKDTNKTAIIIGAGPAGLTAAYELLKTTDIKVIVLEATDVIGGISQTVVYKGNRMDIGGHRFFSKDDRVNEFWKNLMPLQGKPAYDDKVLGREKPLAEGGPDPETEERVMLVRTRVSRIYFLKKFFAYPITLSAETIKNMGFVRTIKAGFGYVWSAVFKKKETNLRNFYINRFGKPLYEMFFEDYTEKVWGVNPENISAEWGAQRVKGLSLFKAVWNIISKPFRRKNSSKVETSLIEQFMYPKKGPGQLWEELAEEVKKLGGEIIMNCPVTEIITENDTVKAVKAGDKTFYGDYFFSSMPVKDLVDGMATVPQDVKEIAHNLPYRDFITVGLLCNKLKIKNQTKMKTLGNIVPDCWIYIQERDVKLGRLQIFNNWSPYMVADPDNTVWIGLEYFCTEGDEMWNMSDKDFIELAKNELVHIGIVDKEDIIDSVRVKIKKAYPSYFGTYEQFDKVKEYLNTFENLYCIGRNGQHRYNNMDHSMLTAMFAVDAVREGKGKAEIWNVNTEKSYHEKK